MMSSGRNEGFNGAACGPIADEWVVTWKETWNGSWRRGTGLSRGESEKGIRYDRPTGPRMELSLSTRSVRGVAREFGDAATPDNQSHASLAEAPTFSPTRS